jgi:hypothetical protein
MEHDTSQDTNLTPKAISTLMQLCQQLELPQQEMDALEAMSLLDGSVESFCACGKFRLFQLLQEDLPADRIGILVDAAFELLRENSKYKEEG